MMQRYRLIYVLPDDQGSRLLVGAIFQEEKNPASWLSAARLPCAGCLGSAAIRAALEKALGDLKQHTYSMAAPRHLGPSFEVGPIRALPREAHADPEAYLLRNILPRD